MAAQSQELPDLTGKVALVTGGSRGIGRMVCLALAKCGCSCVVVGKSTVGTENLPGSVFSVAQEVSDAHPAARGLGVRCDVRNPEDMDSCVQAAVKEFGGIDILINNASALWWQEIKDTPLKKYDLITQINSRASFYLAKLCVPYMKSRGWGRVVCMSPPIVLDPPAMVGKTAYNISKFGMTLTALGVAQEYGPEHQILANSLWPATVIESQASINFELGERKEWRKADILADAVVQLCLDTSTNGQMLIDDTYLIGRGWTSQDLARYRYDPDHEPTRYLDPYGDQQTVEEAVAIRRGDVRQVRQDKSRSKL